VMVLLCVLLKYGGLLRESKFVCKRRDKRI
jgi:hypothetical protein